MIVSIFVYLLINFSAWSDGVSDILPSDVEDFTLLRGQMAYLPSDILPSDVKDFTLSRMMSTLWRQKRFKRISLFHKYCQFDNQLGLKKLSSYSTSELFPTEKKMVSKYFLILHHLLGPQLVSILEKKQ